MNPPTIDPLSQMLGEISAKLDMVQRVQGEDRTAAASWRTDVRTALDAVKDSVADIKNRSNNTADQLAELRADVEERLAKLSVDVDDYRSRRAQAEGASKLTKILWAIFSALGLGGLITLLEKFRH